MSDTDDRKIIVDEDWKSQVEREREQLRSQSDAAGDSVDSPRQTGDFAAPHASDPSAPTSDSGPSTSSTSAEEHDSPNESDPYADIELPPASLSMLVSTLATQSLAAMGQLPDPETGKPVIRPNYAKYQIDMLAMLKEKTQCHATPDEAKMLEGTLHELRMIYVQFVASRK